MAHVIKLNGGYVCSLCHMQFQRKFNADRHIMGVHNTVVPNIDDNTNLISSSIGDDNIGYDDATDCAGDKLCLSPPTKQFKSDNKYDAVDGIGKGSFSTEDYGDVEQNNILEPISQVSKGMHNIVDITFSDSESSQSSIISDQEESSDDEDLLDIDDDWLYNSLPTHSKLSIKDHGAAVMGFTVRHNISHEAVKDLLTLINLHIPENSKSFKSFSKLKHALGTFADDDITIIEYCENCSRIWPSENKDEYFCPTEGCNSIRYKGNPDNKVIKEYFLTSSIESQLKTILQREGMWKKIQGEVDKRSLHTQTINDIIQREMYQKLCAPGGILFKNSNLTTIFNTDGVALYKSSRIEVWPVYVAINEIPAVERFHCKNVCLWGVWQGRGKPPIHTFLKPFVDAMKVMASIGLTISLPTGVQHIKLYPITCSIDLIAKAQCLSMVQHNGYYGCKDCLIKGDHIPSGKGYVHCYKYSEAINAAARDDESFISDAIESYQTGQVVNGIKGASALLELPEFSITKGVVPDYMHGVLLGITKTLLLLWFDASVHRMYYKKHRSYPDYYIAHEINTVDERLGQMKPPDCISRRPRLLTGNLHHLKANELRAWLLFYSLPCLVNILPTPYWNHFAHLVEAMHLFLGSEITTSKLEKGDLCLLHFYEQFAVLYEHNEGKSGLNVHNLIHLSNYVKWWGPLWAWSCFGFESLNGAILKQVHGTKNGCRQILISLNGLKNIHRINDSSGTSQVVKDFLGPLLHSRKYQSWTSTLDWCCFGGRSQAIPSSNATTNLLKRFNITVTDVLKKYLRLKIKNISYTCTEYKRSKKTINFAAVVNENSDVSLVILHYFIHVETKNMVLYVGHALKRINDWSVLPMYKCSQLMRVQEESHSVVVGNAKNIKEKLFLISGNEEFLCVARIPNTVEGD